MPLMLPVVRDRPDLSSLGRFALDWLECDRRARLMLSSVATVVWMNEAARLALKLDPAVSIHGKTLSFASHAEGLSFAQVIAVAGPDATTLAVPFVRGSGHYLIRAWRLGDPLGSVFGVEITVDHPNFVARYADFKAIFALTAAEHETAQAMIAGLSAQEIAVRRKVTIDTVRSHVRGIYAKLGVSTREQFYRRLSAFRIG